MRERATTENGLAGPSRSPGAPAPLASHLRSVAHTSHAPALHIADEVWSPSRRQDGVDEEPQSDAISASTPEQPPAEAAPAAATLTTGRGTRRGRDISPFVSVEEPDQLNRSFLEGCPAPRDSKDASGQSYDNAMSWVSARLQKQRTFKEAEKVI